jgi:hypothetical protein
MPPAHACVGVASVTPYRGTRTTATVRRAVGALAAVGEVLELAA